MKKRNHVAAFVTLFTYKCLALISVTTMLVSYITHARFVTSRVNLNVTSLASSCVIEAQRPMKFWPHRYHSESVSLS